ncbi:MAG: hypothetical protein CAF45_013500 [Nitrospira sp. CG24E]|nr:MAG: hypothetical protein CAF45_013500 [Nitrospira sp. CG24E]
MPNPEPRMFDRASSTCSAPRAARSVWPRGRIGAVVAGAGLIVAFSWAVQFVQITAEQGLAGCGRAILAQLDLGWTIGEEDKQNSAAGCSKRTAFASAQLDRVNTHPSLSRPAARKEAGPTLRSVEPPSKAGMPIADLLSILFGPQSVHAEDVASRTASTDSNRVSGSELPKPAAEPVEGPALIVPEEMVALFQQRKQDLERRENIVRTAEGRVAILKAEVEQILNKIEAAEQRRLDQEKVSVGQQASQREHAADLRKQHLGQLAKIYESMPAEEAAARIERMADRKALEILRLLKSKSAGAILAQVKVDRAAKLTEELLATP